MDEEEKAILELRKYADVDSDSTEDDSPDAEDKKDKQFRPTDTFHEQNNLWRVENVYTEKEEAVL